jgi:hypothetical protein
MLSVWSVPITDRRAVYKAPSIGPIIIQLPFLNSSHSASSEPVATPDSTVPPEPDLTIEMKLTATLTRGPGPSTPYTRSFFVLPQWNGHPDQQTRIIFEVMYCPPDGAVIQSQYRANLILHNSWDKRDMGHRRPLEARIECLSTFVTNTENMFIPLRAVGRFHIDSITAAPESGTKISVSNIVLGLACRSLTGTEGTVGKMCLRTVRSSALDDLVGSDSSANDVSGDGLGNNERVRQGGSAVSLTVIQNPGTLILSTAAICFATGRGIHINAPHNLDPNFYLSIRDYLSWGDVGTTT